MQANMRMVMCSEQCLRVSMGPEAYVNVNWHLLYFSDAWSVNLRWEDRGLDERMKSATAES